MRSQRSREGSLLIDYRESPGVSPEILQRSGLTVPFVKAGDKFEAPTLQCSHCQAGVVLNPQRTRDRGYCAKCDHYICDTCVGIASVTLEHRPFRKIRDEHYEVTSRGLPFILK